MKPALLALAALAGLLLLAGCQPVQAPQSAPEGAADLKSVAIRFAMNAGEAPLACGQAVEGLGTAASTAEMNDLRFYVSNVRLANDAGEIIPVALDQDGLWQFEGTALLDFEDGTAGCTETGTPDLNDAVRGTVPAGTYEAILFDLGVPFELNHQDVTVAAH